MSAALGDVGGKAANLIKLAGGGFPVPAFVVLGTEEYQAFVAEHDLGPVIADALARPDPARASEIIRDAFRRPMSDDQRHRITEALRPVSDRPVAVRSSATAEDLPEASFAGQQDTFLDVRGLDAILPAVVECWSSLWTERAITYRAHNDMDGGVHKDVHGDVHGDAVALAVVVQEMVDADASGVLFTADPLTGHRGRTSIDAVLGLGEKLVSGQVTPDHFLIDTATGDVLDRSVQQAEPTLTDAQLRALTALGRRVADFYGSPQDIEWTRVGDALSLVQSRPITSLYPLPAGARQDDLWFSFGAFQGMLQPITPLGLDTIQCLAAGAATLFGVQLDYRSNRYLQPAGQRLWIRLDDVLRHPLGHRALPRILRGVDPNAASLVRRLAEDPAYAARPARTLRTAAPALVGALGPLLPRLAGTVWTPERLRLKLDRDVDRLLEALHERLDAAGAIARPELRLAARLRAFDWIAAEAFRTLLPDFFPIMGPSILMTQRLRELASQTGLPDADALALRVLRSLPGNVTTEMDLALWAVARSLREDPASTQALTARSPEELAAGYLAGTLPPVVQLEVRRFMDRYGMRGVAEIDLGAPRWREQPEAVFRTLASYLDLDAERAPDALYEAGRRDAEEATQALVRAFGRRRAKAAQVGFLSSHIRALFGARETPKFTLIRAFGLLREALLASGADLVDAGVLDAPGDVFFLRLDELRGAFTLPGLGDLVTERRAAQAQQGRRTRVPVLLVGDGRTFYDGGVSAAGADLAGMGVSPGVAEGAVRVVDDPRTSELRTGEILVCRGTDPAWTPLFLTAAGLVTEVGGLMTHGSVVAREYGLPAVVGVSDATHLLRTGRRIRIDGGSGAITFLDEAPAGQDVG